MICTFRECPAQLDTSVQFYKWFKELADRALIPRGPGYEKAAKLAPPHQVGPSFCLSESSSALPFNCTCYLRAGGPPALLPRHRGRQAAAWRQAAAAAPGARIPFLQPFTVLVCILALAFSAVPSCCLL